MLAARAAVRYRLKDAFRPARGGEVDGAPAPRAHDPELTWEQCIVELARRPPGHPNALSSIIMSAKLAEQFDTTPGAIYRSLDDARLEVRRLTAQLEPVG
jgi:hypothetical protein